MGIWIIRKTLLIDVAITSERIRQGLFERLGQVGTLFEHNDIETSFGKEPTNRPSTTATAYNYEISRFHAVPSSLPSDPRLLQICAPRLEFQRACTSCRAFCIRRVR